MLPELPEYDSASFKNVRDWRTTTFLGVRAAQFQIDFWLWEDFLNKNHVAQFIELGTGRGGLSLFFLLQSRQRGFKFDTFDHTAPEALETDVGQLLEFGKHYYSGDIFDPESMGRILEAKIQSAVHPLMLFCDNGWKPREVQTFAPMLLPGDFCAAHDWGTEIYGKDVPYDILDDYFVNESESLGSLTRWFRRK